MTNLIESAIEDFAIKLLSGEVQVTFGKEAA
jgi:hypothetical protein